MALLVGAVFAFAAPQFSGEYTGAISDKIERAESIDEPKIVLVGNSNLAFGIDSETIEEAFGRPVVNMGGHGGLGNAFHINMGRHGINEGDIVVIALTSYDKTSGLTPDLAWITVENYGLLDLIPEEDYYHFIKAFPHYAIRTVGRWITGTGNRPRDGIYSISNFNEYGDICLVREESMQENYMGKAVPPALGDTVQLLNEYIAWCNEQGAVCVIAAYPIITCEALPPSGEDFDRFAAELDAALDCDVISDYKDYFMDRRYFYDTEGHLTDEGTVIRTAQLIEDLKNWSGYETHLKPAA
jgi:hypothetical protein